MTLDPRSIDPRAFGGVEPGTEEAAQDLAQDCARAMWQRDAASKSLGVRLDDIGPGRATMVMTVRADMVNAFGTCHGAFIYSLAHSCFAYACNAYDRINLASSGHIDFLAPALEGEQLNAVAEERSRSGRTGLYDVTVRNAAGVTVALFRGKSHITRAHITQARVAP